MSDLNAGIQISVTRKKTASLHSTPPTLGWSPANAAAVEFMHAHAIAGAWGDTKDCAADAMSLDVSRLVQPVQVWLCEGGGVPSGSRQM
jgi:hypothetical protein